MTTTRATGAASRGFTLVEMLIALTLLSVLMLILSSALRGMGQVETRVDQRIEAADDHRLAMRLLSGVLGHVSARRHAAAAVDAAGAQQVPFFEAAADSLSWIGVMPARFGLGGRHYLHLALEADADGVGLLVLRYAPWTGAPTFHSWEQADAVVLATQVSAVSLHYQELLSGQWSPVWPPPELPLAELPPSLLPAAVAIQVDGLVPAWPPLMVALRPTFRSDPSIVRADFGGSR